MLFRSKLAMTRYNLAMTQYYCHCEPAKQSRFSLLTRLYQLRSPRSSRGHKNVSLRSNLTFLFASTRKARSPRCARDDIKMRACEAISIFTPCPSLSTEIAIPRGHIALRSRQPMGDLTEYVRKSQMPTGLNKSIEH